MRILLQMEDGRIEIEVFEDQAPLTSAYILGLIDRGDYDEATFYRSSTLGVEGGPRLIQGGPLGDFPQLDFGGRSQPDELGFPAFGEVVIGLDIAEKIAESETAGEVRIGMLEGQILTRAVAITAAHRNESPS